MNGWNFEVDISASCFFWLRGLVIIKKIQKSKKKSLDTIDKYNNNTFLFLISKSLYKQEQQIWQTSWKNDLLVNWCVGGLIARKQYKQFVIW